MKKIKVLLVALILSLSFSTIIQPTQTYAVDVDDLLDDDSDDGKEVDTNNDETDASDKDENSNDSESNDINDFDFDDEGETQDLDDEQTVIQPDRTDTSANSEESKGLWETISGAITSPIGTGIIIVVFGVIWFVNRKLKSNRQLRKEAKKGKKNK